MGVDSDRAQHFEKILLVGWRLEKKLGGHDYNINLLEKSGGGAQFLGVNLNTLLNA